MAMNEGTTLSNTVNDSPVLMVKSLRASDFQGIWHLLVSCLCYIKSNLLAGQSFV
jgi:hypothetical protein